MAEIKGVENDILLTETNKDVQPFFVEYFIRCKKIVFLMDMIFRFPVIQGKSNYVTKLIWALVVDNWDAAIACEMTIMQYLNDFETKPFENYVIGEMGDDIAFLGVSFEKAKGKIIINNFSKKTISINSDIIIRGLNRLKDKPWDLRNWAESILLAPGVFIWDPNDDRKKQTIQWTFVHLGSPRY